MTPNRDCYVNVGLELAPDEPLSPELVLVLPAELRAEAIARLGPPAWPKPRPRPRLVVVPTPPFEAPSAADEPFVRYVGALVAARLAQLALIFIFVTIVTLALSIVANAFR
jgi:hypothetical protein